MSLASPVYCWLLLLLLPAVYLHFRSAKAVRRGRALFGDHPRWGHQSLSHPLLLTVTYLLIVVALCRPQWNESSAIRELHGLEILVALDCSKSMLADDLKPDRLAAAKAGIARLVDNLQGDRIGLIPFAGSSFMTCPLTSDYGLFKEMLAATGPESIPLAGSDPGRVAAEAIRGFNGKKPATCLLILISDGEDFSENTAEAAYRLKESGYMVRTVMSGSERGAVIPLAGGGFHRDRNGGVVFSRAREASLRLFSEPVHLDHDGTTLLRLYNQARSTMQLQTVREEARQKVERFQLPLGAALLTLALSVLCLRRGQ